MDRRTFARGRSSIEQGCCPASSVPAAASRATPPFLFRCERTKHLVPCTRLRRTLVLLEKDGALRRGFCREGFDAGRGELEADQPLTGNVAATDFGRGEFPTANGFQRRVREILTRTGILEVGVGNIAGGVNMSHHGDAHLAGNRRE